MEIKIQYWRQFDDIIKKEPKKVLKGTNVIFLVFNNDVESVRYLENLVELIEDFDKLTTSNVFVIGMNYKNKDQDFELVKKRSKKIQSKLTDLGIKVEYFVMEIPEKDEDLLSSHFSQYLSKLIQHESYHDEIGWKFVFLGNSQEDLSNIEKSIIGRICFRSYDTPIIKKLGVDFTIIYWKVEM